MADTELMKNNYIVSTKEICAIFGLKSRRIQQLADENAIIRAGHGKYDLPQSVKAYTDYLTNKQNGPSGENDKQMEELLYTRARREKTELQVKIIRGELHRAEDVERVMNGMLGNFRGKLLSFPTKFAPKVVGKTDLMHVRNVLKKGIYEVMKELADYDPNVFFEMSKDKMVLDDEDEDVSANGTT